MEEEPREIAAKDLLFSDDTAARKLPPICPKCGTWNPPEAKFCKKDGVKLPERGRRPGSGLAFQPDAQSNGRAAPPTGTGTGNIGISQEVNPAAAGMELPMGIPQSGATSGRNHASPVKRPLPQIPRKYLPLFIVICALLLVIAGAGSYRYLSSDRSAAIQQPPEEKAEEKPVAQGEVNAPAPPPPRPEPAAQTSPQPADIQTPSSRPKRQHKEQVKKAADRKPPEKRAPVASVVPKKEIKDVKPKDEQPDPAKTEGKLNRLLRSSGVGGVTAEVGENMAVTLKGTVRSSRDKARALSAAKSLREVKGVKDIIFVIEP